MGSATGYGNRARGSRAEDTEAPSRQLFLGFLSHAHAENALVAVTQEADIQGISTRSIDELVKAMGMSGISKSQVPRLCSEIDERVDAF